jgi:hypothetical protein
MKKLIFALSLGFITPFLSFSQTEKALPKASSPKKRMTKTPAKPVRKKVITPSADEKTDLTEPAYEKAVDVVKTSEPMQVNGNGGMPVMKFNTKSADFGKIKTGDKPVFEYEFINTGDAALEISIVSACDCTEIEHTTGEVPPGGKGYLRAVYNTLKAEPGDHKKQQKKYIDVILKQTHPKSGYPLVEQLTFDVFIID